MCSNGMAQYSPQSGGVSFPSTMVAAFKNFPLGDRGFSDGPHRMKLQNNYHDAILSEVHISADELTFVADLNGHWNQGCEQRASLMFHKVKNLAVVCETLGLDAEDGKHQYDDEIIGILRSDKSRYLIDLAKASDLWIDCGGLSEA